MKNILPNRLHLLAIIMAAIALLNLPTFMSATKGNGSLLSYIMLGAGLYLYGYLFFKRQFDSNNVLYLLALTLFSYLTVGIIVKLLWEENELTTVGSSQVGEWAYTVRVMLQTLLVTCATYKYTLFCHNQGQINRFSNAVIAIALFSSIITILSPLLGFYQPGFFVDERANSGGLLRPAGLYMNPNTAGFHAVTTLLLVISLLFRAKTSRILVFAMILISLLSA